tara:strand:+ start:444 stop:1043 length:600 start_codon:yes stop_codon:yes gene_type:complete
MAKQLLREYYELCDGGICQDLLTEAEKEMVTEGHMILTGLCQRALVENGNRRVYSEQVLGREVGKYQSLIKDKRSLGELDHPDSSVVSLEKVSHMIISLWMEGKDVYAKLLVLPTPAGNILKALVNSGCSIGISSRGMGSVREQGGQTIVEDDFQLICFDMVSEASTHGAYMEAVQENSSLNENKVAKLNRLLDDIIKD